MTNYNQANIYRKQMQELGLNTKQYAELIEMPYEVVKDIIYDKEGDYSMEIKNLLRRNMMNKHQDIENNFENAKIKAMELKHESNSMNWYLNEYKPQMIKEQLNISSRNKFEEKYDILVDGKKASRWFYTCILGKINYNNHEIRKEVVEQFVEQLYDILVNKNDKQYLSNGKFQTKEISHKQKTNILKWFKNYDFTKYLKENDMSRTQLAENCDINYTTLCHLIAKKRNLTYETDAMRKIYNFINNNVSYDTTTEAQEQDICSNTIHEIRQAQINGETNKIEELKKEHFDMINNAQVFIAQKEEPKIEIINNDDILRKILINRLTEEEKELIRLFGGKIC